MTSTLLFLFMIVGYGVLISLLFRGKFEQGLPCAVFGIILVLYVSGLISGFIPGFFLIMLGLPVCGLICVIKLRRRLWRELKNGIWTPGFFFFVVSISVMIPCILNKHINTWDEFSHWSTAIKNFWYLNDFANLESATTTYKGYPPAATLFAHFAQKMGRNYVECKSYLAYDVFYLALMAPLFLMIKEKKDWWKGILLGLCCILLPVAFWNNTYDVTMVDMLIGMLFIYIFVVYFIYENGGWKWTGICLGIIILCLTKASGAGLAAIAMITIAVSELVISRPGERLSAHNLKRLGTMLLCWLVGKYSWDIYLRATKTVGPWDTSDMTVTGIIELLTGRAPEYRIATVKNFFHEFVFERLGTGIIQLSPLVWLALFLIGMGLLIRLADRDLNRRKLAVCVSGVSAGFVIYTISLLLLYVFTFSEGEARDSASFWRYMGTYLEILAAFAVIMFLIYTKRKWKWVCALAVTGLISYLPIFSSIATATPVLADRYSDYLIDIRFQRLKDEMEKRGIVDKNTRMYFIHQEDAGFWYYVCAYGMTPYHIQPKPLTYDLSGPEWEAEGAAKWRTLLDEGDYTFVFLNHVTPEFSEEYGELFENMEDIEDACLYRVIRNGTEHTLKKELNIG